MSNAKGKNWPKLSELLGERSPACCQSCGLECDLHRWREHDDLDQPTGVIVVLCIECSDRIVEPHPRLYSEIEDYAPDPGSMNCCTDCVLRHDLTCQHPSLKANGGIGLAIKYAQPQTMFIDGERNGRAFGEILRTYAFPPTCGGRLTREGYLQITRNTEFNGIPAVEIAALRIPSLEAIALMAEESKTS